MVAQPSIPLMNLVTMTLGEYLQLWFPSFPPFRPSDFFLHKTRHAILWDILHYIRHINVPPSRERPGIWICKTAPQVRGFHIWLLAFRRNYRRECVDSPWLSLITYDDPTQQWVVTVIGIFEGFIYFHDGLAANIYFNDNSRVTETVEDIFIGLSILIGDSMIVSSFLFLDSVHYIVCRSTVSGSSGLSTKSSSSSPY